MVGTLAFNEDSRASTFLIAYRGFAWEVPQPRPPLASRLGMTCESVATLVDDLTIQNLADLVRERLHVKGLGQELEFNPRVGVAKRFTVARRQDDF